MNTDSIYQNVYHPNFLYSTPTDYESYKKFNTTNTKEFIPFGFIFFFLIQLKMRKILTLYHHGRLL